MTEKEVLEIIEKAARDGWTEVDFSNQGIESLPGEIGRLTELTWLDLSHNKLRSVPAELGELTNLTTLDLGDNQLTSVPAELGRLANLTTLNLVRNQLTSLPGELGKLTELTKLRLEMNQLTSVPAELGNLTNLTVLHLGGNQLTSVPAELGNLTNLTGLNLGDNQLTSVPAELGKLTKLTKLYLYRNKLRSLPAELAKLTKLTELHLEGNPFVSPPGEVVRQGGEAVLAYLRERLKVGGQGENGQQSKQGSFTADAILVNAEGETEEEGGKGKVVHGVFDTDEDLRPKEEAKRGVVGVSIGGSSVSDQPAKIDALGFEPYTRAIANFLSHEDTSPPLTMSVEGEWGSGKSSFMMQLEDKLEGEGGLIVKFSPWRHDEHESLWAAFALEFARQLAEKLTWRKALKARIRLMWERFNWREGWVEVGKAGAVWLVYALVLAGVIVIVWGQGLPYVRNVVLKLLASVAAVAGVVSIGLKKVKDFVGSPLRFDLKKYVETPDYAARVCFVERFHRDFKKIIDVYAKEKRVYVFIDDLDRCEVPKAANLMQAISLMISDSPSVVFIMGMDRQKVAAGLAVKDEHIIPYVNPELVSDTSGGGQDSHWLSGLKYGYEFIEKFIQLPFSVPRPRGSDIEEMMDSIAGKKRREEKGGRAAVTGGKVAERMSIGDEGSPRDREVAARGGDATGEKEEVEKSREKETREFELSIADDSPEVRDIVLMAAPALDFNPRRIKQFINLFRLRAYIAYETGQLASRENAGRGGQVTLDQLGKIVAILLKWPLLLESLAQDKKMLVRLSRFAEGNSYYKEVDKRWSGDSQLMQLLRFGCLDKQGKQDAEGKRYSLVGVGVDSLLEVSPRVRIMGEVSLSGEIRGVSTLEGRIDVKSAGSTDGRVDEREVQDGVRDAGRKE